MTYLVAAIKHADKDIESLRLGWIQHAAEKLSELGDVACPILDADCTKLRECEKLAVLMLPGWEDSPGIKRSISFAEMERIPIDYLHADFAIECAEPCRTPGSYWPTHNPMHGVCVRCGKPVK